MMNDRTKFIGSSDIGPLLGLSLWTTPLQLYLEKTEGQPAADPEREKLFRRGKRAEPYIIETAQEEYDLNIVDRNEITHDAEFPFLRAEIDFTHRLEPDECHAAGSIANGECKSVDLWVREGWGEALTDEIPVVYTAQVMFGMAITGRQQCNVVAAFGYTPRMYVVPRDEELCQELRGRAAAFWRDHVLAKVPPPPQTTEDAKKMLRRFAGFVSPGSQATWEAIRRLKGIREAQKRLKHAVEREELAVQRQLLLEAEAMGVGSWAAHQPENYEVLGPDGKKALTMKWQRRAGYEVKPTEFWVVRCQ